MASPKFTAMMKARRTIKGVPYPRGEALEEILRANYGADGLYKVTDDPLLSPRTAYYPEDDRYVRRHELMHGIRHAASEDAGLAAAVPWWARGDNIGGFRDELLARLASKKSGALSEWDTAAYPRKSLADKVLYSGFNNGRNAAEFVVDNPGLIAGAATGAGLLGYGMSIPEERAVADEHHSLDRMIERLGRQ